MKIKLPKAEPRYVIGSKYLPMSLYKVAVWAVLYSLLTKVYTYPAWADWLAIIVLVVGTLHVCVCVGKQVEVNPFEVE